MKKYIVIIISIFAVLLLMPPTESVHCNARESIDFSECSLYDTDQNEITIAQDMISLFPPSEAMTSVPISFHILERNSFQQVYKTLLCNLQQEIKNEFQLSKTVASFTYKIISQAVNYYIFFLRKIIV